MTPHKGRVFLVLAVYPVPEEVLTVLKSPFAITSEILAYFERVGRGTYSPPGKVLNLVDSFFMQRSVFLRCEDGTFVFQDPCIPSTRSPCRP